MRFRHFFYKLKDNPKAIFISGIISKWYLLIMIPSLTVGYFVLKGLEKAGILEKVENSVTSALGGIIGIAKECTPLIVKFYDFIECLNRY